MGSSIKDRGNDVDEYEKLILLYNDEVGLGMRPASICSWESSSQIVPLKIYITQYQMSGLKSVKSNLSKEEYK